MDVACVKVAFSQEIEGEEKPFFEHMWINDVFFDGENVYGTLINTPSVITNVKSGDFIEVPLNQISDWFFSSEGKTYGGFSIQAMRSEMSEEKSEEHDAAWGMDFEDFDDLFIVTEEKENPENLIEHPMSVNMKESFLDFIQQNPDEIYGKDEFGYALLHREVISGNRTMVEILIDAGTDVTKKHQLERQL